jgi:ankyrin repeat protein
LPYFKEVIDDDSNEYGWTPLLWAATKGDIKMIEEL